LRGRSVHGSAAKSFRPSATESPEHWQPFGVKAVIQYGKVRMSGYLAWWLWSIAHIYILIGFRNRLAVALTWAWTYASF
jgi:hypothetical protein